MAAYLAQDDELFFVQSGDRRSRSDVGGLPGEGIFALAAASSTGP
jgi:hypothetical protein